MMFSCPDDDAALRPPALVTTMGRLKEQYDESGRLSPPRQQQQQRRHHPGTSPRGQAEDREQHWGGDARVGNGLAVEERDRRTQTENSDYQRPTAMGSSPPPGQRPQIRAQQLSSREAAAYKTAIKAVDDSVNADGRGSVTALRGLWKVFDAVVSELGAELNDSLSNKAIFEANVMQETLSKHGRRISDLEKKSDAMSRKARYEAALERTVLRLRGSFADAILGAKKEIQGSIDESFAAKMAEAEESFERKSADVEKAFAKRMIEAERQFAGQITDMERSAATRAAEMERSLKQKMSEKDESHAMMMSEKDELLAMKIAELEQSSRQRSSEKDELFAMNTAEMESSFNARIESTKESANMEIARLHNKFNQAEQAAAIVRAQLRKSEQAVNVFQAQLAQERSSYRQAITEAERSREDAATKLSSTLETLQHTCTSARALEAKLSDAEGRLELTKDRLRRVEYEQRQESDAASERWSAENERANLLQQKLDSELKNKIALIDIQKEMEEHLGLERERGDLLQQELEAEARSREGVARSMQEDDRQRSEEHDRTYQENVALKERINAELERADRASQENRSLKEQVKIELDRADRASQENFRLTAQLRSKTDCADRLSQEIVCLREKVKSELDRADRAFQESASLKERAEGELDRAARENMRLREQMKSDLDRAAQENTHLQDQLRRDDEANSSLKAELDELQSKFEEQLATLRGCKSEYSQLSNEFRACRDRLDKTSEMNSLLEAKAERLDAKVQDQLMDLEAARLSEADVEKSLAESLRRVSELEANRRCVRMEERQRVGELESRLMHALNEVRTITEQLAGESRLKGEKAAALEEAESQLAGMRKTKIELESERDELKDELAKARADIGKLRRSSSGLESETIALKAELEKAEKNYGLDREKIAEALSGFDEEMSNAETKLRSVLDELEEEKSKVKNLAETHEKAAGRRAAEEKNLRQKMEDERKRVEDRLLSEKKNAEDRLLSDKKDMERKLRSEKKAVEDRLVSENKRMENEIARLKEERNAEASRYQQDLSKFQQDVGVYEEAIKMLQKQVDILQELADAEADAECEHRTSRREGPDEKEKVDAIDIEAAKEEAKMEATRAFQEERQELLSRIHQGCATIKKLQARCDEMREEAEGETRRELREERRELLRRIEAQKSEHDDAMARKNASVDALREKCDRSEASTGRLERLCAKARKDLLELRSQKTRLEGSLERSTRRMEDFEKSQREAVDAEGTDAIEVVAKSPRLGRKAYSVRFQDDVTFVNDLDDTSDYAPDVKASAPSQTCKDIGSELDTLLACIEAQLGVGQCGGHEIEPQSQKRGRTGGELATRSW